MSTTARPDAHTGRPSPPARPRPRRWRLVVALTAALALLAASCGDDGADTATGDGGTGAQSGEATDRPTIEIGAQDFPESIVLSEVYRQALEAHDYEVEVQEVGGFRDILFGAIESGDVNFAVDYLASELNFLADEELATSDVDETLAELQPFLTDRDMVAFTPADAVNTNVFVMTAEVAEDEGVSELGDLEDDMVLGAPADCLENAFCVPGLRDVYDVDLEGGFTPLETGSVIDSLRNDLIDVGVLFSTDPELADDDLVVLEDTEGMFAADNVLPVTTREVSDAYGGELTNVVDEVTAELTTDVLIELNSRFTEDNEDAEVVASDWLEENDLV